MPKKKDKDTFEYSFKRLEEILDKLENEIEDYSLEEILDYYQEALRLLKVCKKKLTEAELKIEKINIDNDL